MRSAFLKKKLLATTFIAGFAGSLVTGLAYAQDSEEDDTPVVIEEIDEDDEARQERVVVTVSRLSRTEFTSASPLKVINIQESISAGLVDTATIVQRTSVAGGAQTDNTFTGIVTDGGPGSATVGLRGLDEERTLILANGRRLAPAGVAGSPTRPDLSLIPLGMIERTEILTDGAPFIIPNCRDGSCVEVQERSSEAEPRKSAPLCRASQACPVMPLRDQIHRDLFVLRQRRAADRGIPERATMRRGDLQRLADHVAQGLQAIEKVRIVPISPRAEAPATATGELGQIEIWPAPGRKQ